MQHICSLAVLFLCSSKLCLQVRVGHLNSSELSRTGRREGKGTDALGGQSGCGTSDNSYRRIYINALKGHRLRAEQPQGSKGQITQTYSNTSDQAGCMHAEDSIGMYRALKARGL